MSPFLLSLYLAPLVTIYLLQPQTPHQDSITTAAHITYCLSLALRFPVPQCWCYPSQTLNLQLQSSCLYHCHRYIIRGYVSDALNCKRFHNHVLPFQLMRITMKHLRWYWPSLPCCTAMVHLFLLRRSHRQHPLFPTCRAAHAFSYSAPLFLSLTSSSLQIVSTGNSLMIFTQSFFLFHQSVYIWMSRRQHTLLTIYLFQLTSLPIIVTPSSHLEPPSQ